MNGQKGYHGVAILSRLPFDATSTRGFCGKTDSRHVTVTLGEKAKLKDPLTLHNLYVPAGGDIPDPAAQSEIRAQAIVPGRDARMRGRACEGQGARDPARRSQCRAARARCVEPQAVARRRVAHADRMREAHRRAHIRRLGRRHARARSRAAEALHLVELSLAGLEECRQGPPARSHVAVARARGRTRRHQDRQGCARLGSAVGSRAGHGDDVELLRHLRNRFIRIASIARACCRPWRCEFSSGRARICSASAAIWSRMRRAASG